MAARECELVGPRRTLSSGEYLGGNGAADALKVPAMRAVQAVAAAARRRELAGQMNITNSKN